MSVIGKIITKRPILLSFVFFVGLAILITGTTKMKFATGNETMMSTDSEVFKENQRFEKYFGGETIIVINTSEQENGILTVTNFKRMKELEDRLKQYDEIYAIISPISIVNQLTSKQAEKMQINMVNLQQGHENISNQLNGYGKQMKSMSEIMNIGNKLRELSRGIDQLILNQDILYSGLPSSQTTLDRLLYENGQLRPSFQELILDQQHSIMIVKLKGNTEDAKKEEIVAAIKEQLKRAPMEGVISTITGKPVLDSAVRSSMKESMKKMILIALFIMVIVLILIFQVRWRILAIPIILVSVFATLGWMGYIGVPMTMVSMAVFPILIGLGVDYAIQFQNRYEEEYLKEEMVDA